MLTYAVVSWDVLALLDELPEDPLADVPPALARLWAIRLWVSSMSLWTAAIFFWSSSVSQTPLDDWGSPLISCTSAVHAEFMASNAT